EINRLVVGDRGLGSPELPSSWELEPDQGQDLQYHTGAERDLVCSHGIVSIDGRPLLQDQPDRKLQKERAAEVKDIQGAIGSPCKLGGKVLRHDRIAQHRTGADSGNDRPSEI